MFNTRFVPLRTAALCACLLPTVLIAGCGGGSSSTPTTPVNTGPVTSVPRTANGFQFSLTADKSVYKVGDAVHFTLAVKYIGANPLSFVSQPAGNDAAVTLNGKVIWQYSVINPPYGGGSVVSGKFLPETSEVMMFTWNAGAVGTYTLTAWYNPISLGDIPLQNAQVDLAANPVQITVSP